MNIHEVFKRLSEEGITRVLVEGGAQLASTLVAEDLLDEVVLFRADEIGDGLTVVLLTAVRAELHLDISRHQRPRRGRR